MAESKKKVLFVCSFSSQKIRERLLLKKWKLRNMLMRYLKHPRFVHLDKGVWASDFIQEFEKHPEYEYHVLSPHKGLKRSSQFFDLNGIHYCFFKSDYNLLTDTLNAKFKLEERSDYKRDRKVMREIINKVNPDIVVICGAENPEYSSIALDIDDRPVYVLLQTVLNNPKLAQYTNEARGYRADLEKRIFKKIRYFGTGGEKYYSLFHGINPDALCLSIRFPSHKPPVFLDLEKKYDFVFFGRLTKNKGIEDAIKAMGKLVQTHPETTLCVIGGGQGGNSWIHRVVIENNVQNNIIFVPRFELIDDLYKEVQKSRIALLPGITAFNSTARESILMGLPTIVYDLPRVKAINAEKWCLLSAKMEDVDDLCAKMVFALDNPEELAVIAANGKEYAENYYDNTLIGDKITANIKAIIDQYYQGVPIPKDLLFAMERK